MASKTPWPGLPDNLSFDMFDDEDLIFDYINSLEKDAKKIFIDALDQSKGEDTIVYARNLLPVLHVVLMKFANEKDGGLVLLLSRSENNIYSYFERLKEQNPDHVQFIDERLNIIFEQVRSADEIMNKKK